GCAVCGARLKEIEASRARARESAGFHRVKARLRAPAPRRWTWVMVGAPALAAIAAVLLLVVRPPEVRTRVKGAFSVVAVAADGSEVQRARPGDRLNLAVGSAGRSQVLVLGVDEAGEVDILWPPVGSHSVPAPPGAKAVLQPSFAVTPGSFALYALFSNETIDGGPAKAALRAEVQATRAAGRGPLDTPAPSGPWDGAAKLVLQVAP
ncbi:MAG TPA: hypothetical protein VFA20_19810, partial [Myxococcaceae bacterium]|nr:hypothetical protein [Myxococcaceae bacterium]